MNAPEPLEVERLVSDDERRPAPFPNTARARCLKLLNVLVGEGGLQAFLQSRQPDLDDRTGADLLERSPEQLLERLERLEAQKSIEAIDEEIDEMTAIDPYDGDPPSRRKDKESARLLAILDNLERGNA